MAATKGAARYNETRQTRPLAFTRLYQLPHVRMGCMSCTCITDPIAPGEMILSVGWPHNGSPISLAPSFTLSRQLPLNRDGAPFDSSAYPYNLWEGEELPPEISKPKEFFCSAWSGKELCFVPDRPIKHPLGYSIFGGGRVSFPPLLPVLSLGRSLVYMFTVFFAKSTKIVFLPGKWKRGCPSCPPWPPAFSERWRLVQVPAPLLFT